MTRKVLLLGIGNPGRGDDGLGPALAEALQEMQIPGLTVDADYQLTVEDAVDIAAHDLVIFADADAAGPEPFSWRVVKPFTTLEFSSHGVEPSTVLGLAKHVYGHSPPAYVLGIRGYRFDEFDENLGLPAQNNLHLALQNIELVLRDFQSTGALPSVSAGASINTPCPVSI